MAIYGARYEFLGPILDPLFGPLLNLPPFWSIIIITFIVVLITTLTYKKLTDQEVLKSLKAEMKEIRTEINEARKGGNISKISELNKKSMEKSMIQMKQSFKPMLITMLPILIIFAWLLTNLAYHPIQPDMEFITTAIFEKGTEGNVNLIVPEGITLLSEEEQEIEQVDSEWRAEWKLKGEEGDYELHYEFGDETKVRDILITNGKDYKSPRKIIKDSQLKFIDISNQPIRVLGLSWFWAYFIMSIIFSIILRKLFRVH
jgi:uncharacterized membrane protein (DUF106 family)